MSIYITINTHYFYQTLSKKSLTAKMFWGFRGGAPRRGGVRKTRPFGRLRDLSRGCRQGTTVQGECRDRPLAGWHDRAEQLGL